MLIVLFDGVQSLDVTGPLEVFANAPGYRVTTASLGGRPVTTSSNLTITPATGLESLSGHGHLLIVPGGEGARRRDPALVRWLSDHARNARTTASVCTGTFLLAEVGLITGRRVTTHWAYCAELAAQYPGLTVDPDPIFIKSGAPVRPRLRRRGRRAARPVRRPDQARGRTPPPGGHRRRR